ncbi:cadherin-like domain-containing protein [Cellulophaga baltica]|uniref:cadherin-like domain-containing protein n=1 Tax=Cellulophaga baltica TaxID=76594 RepID=UPI0021480413|nr:cadherin-like domain-containing protein [Cellulophaga baltica]MCR1025128.1 cadherin-like domain-containing protein [Cellulophaga baltica]
MKIPHFTKCLGSLLAFALLTFSCSQDTETTFAELIVEETIATETITPEEEVTEEAAEPIIDYQKGTLVLSEDTKVALDITKGAEENSTSKKTYSLKSITQPKNGKTEMNNNNEIVYSPAADYNGDDSFSYTLNIQDSTETTVEQVNTFNITITPTKDVVDDVVTTTYETAKTIAPLANDTFAASSSVSITEISLANKGIAVLNSDNTITYTPNKATSGEDQIQYKTSITNSDASVSTENGTLKVTILNNVQPTGANIKYVTTTGKSTNTGATEASAWSISHAFNTAKAGDIVYIKAGNYGAVNLVVKNSGNASNPIQFIGYKTNPGDTYTNSYSTFEYGDKIDENKLPLISGNDSNTGLAIDINRDYIQLSNIQISKFQTGINTTGNFLLIKNIVISAIGEQSNNTKQNGKALQIYGDNTIIEDSFILNANAEGINIKGGQNCEIKRTKVYSDNVLNPGGYYILISFGGKYNLIEDCIIYRNKNADLHQGHGFVLKDKASSNIIKGGIAYNTGIEVNFSGVEKNTFEDMQIFGHYSEDSKEFSSGIRVLNGAHDNIFNRIKIKDSRYPFNFHDYNDGYANPDGDRDETQGGNNNIFIEIDSDTSNSIILCNTVDTKIGTSTSKNNTWINCTFKNVTSIPFYSNHLTTNFKFEKCTFQNINSNTLFMVENNLGNWNAVYEDCKFVEVKFNIPQ